MTIAVASDFHSDKVGAPQVAKQCGLLRTIRNDSSLDHLHLSGDLWSLTLESTVESVTANPDCATLRDAIRWLSDVKKVTLGDGNHDPYSQLPPAERAKFDEWFKCPAVVFTGPQFNVGDLYPGLAGWRFEHGHRKDLDFTSAIWPIVTGALKELLGTKAAMSFMAWVIAQWAKRRVVTPTDIRTEHPEAYEGMTTWMHQRMLNWLLKSDFRGAVFGHSHYDCIWDRVTQAKMFVNDGAVDGYGDTIALVFANAGRTVARLEYVE